MLRLAKIEFPLVLFAAHFVEYVYIMNGNLLDTNKKEKIIFHSKEDMREGVYVDSYNDVYLIDENKNMYEPIEYATYDQAIHNLVDVKKMSVTGAIAVMML